MATFSSSRISCFESCQLQYKFRYIDRIEVQVQDTVETFLGSRVHEALEKLYNDKKFQKILTLKELLDYFNEQWKKNWNDDIIIVREEFDAENFRKMGEKYISDYYNHYHPFNDEVTIDTEKEVLFPLDKDGKYYLKGYIDRLASQKSGKYIIHDYKTSGSLPEKKYLEKDRQLALYALAIKHSYIDCTEIEVVWHYLAFDKEFRIKIDEKRLDEVKKEVLEWIRKIESETEFKPCKSALCDWCLYQDFCPLFSHKAITEKMDANEYLKEDGVVLVNKFAEVKHNIEELKEKEEKIREALIQYAKANNHDIIYGSDVQAKITSWIEPEFPKKGTNEYETLKLMLKDFNKWEEIAEIDTYKLKKMIKEKGWDSKILKEIEAFYREKEQIRIFLNKTNKD